MPVAESIVRAIIEAAVTTVTDENITVEVIFFILFVEDLVHSSSLVYREERQIACMYGIHRRIQCFVLVDMERNWAYERMCLILHSSLDMRELELFLKKTVSLFMSMSTYSKTIMKNIYKIPLL